MFSAVTEYSNSAETSLAAAARNSGSPTLGQYPVSLSSIALIPAPLAFGVLGNGLSPISSSMTSFPFALNALAIAKTVKADSAVRLRAKELSRAMISCDSLLATSENRSNESR
jgi:hypothetical protein